MGGGRWGLKLTSSVLSLVVRLVVRLLTVIVLTLLLSSVVVSGRDGCESGGHGCRV